MTIQFLLFLGVPDYVYETCVAAEPAGTAPFPQPVAAGPYPLDKDGNPSIEACLNQTFAKYYLSAEVGAGFQCLYENKDNLWDAFAGYWKVVAQKFANSPSVIGYELMNEPWAGDVYKHPENLLPGVAEKNYLQPLYEYVHKAIRSVDDEKIIFFEGLTIDYWPIGFTSGPGGSEYNDRQAIAYHIYCPSGSGSIAGEIGCHAIDDEFFYMRRKDVDRIGGGMIMTEFGAIEDEKSELAKLEGNAVLADRYQQSWMYWEFKYFQDITTITPIGESLYTEDGSVSEHKLRILSRTYPMAIAGSDPEYSFNILNGEFSMSYTPLSTVESVSLVGRTTEIYVNQQLFYPNGVNVELSDSVENVLSIQCPEKDSNILTLIQSDSADAKSKSYSIFQKIADYIPWTSASAKDFTVKISPCGRLEKCTCK